MSDLRFPEINQISISGRLTADPESRITQSGKTRVSFYLASNQSYKGKNGEWQQDTAFVPVSVWDKLAEAAAQHLHKGSGAFLTGRLRSRSFDDSNGRKRTVLEVVARTIQFLDKKGDESSRHSFEPQLATASPATDDDDLPF